MFRTVVIGMSMLTVMGTAAPLLAGDCKGCEKVARGEDGFCCGKGRVFSVKLSSQKLYKVLKGKAISSEAAENCPCDGCKNAVKTNGSCDGCKYVGGKMYSSKAAYTLAKGAPMCRELVKACPKRCEQCKAAFEKNGRCASCDVGFVAGRIFETGQLYEAAMAAFTTLTKAVSAAASCEDCAIAMVTDGTCEKCKVKFKDGKTAPNKG